MAGRTTEVTLGGMPRRLFFTPFAASLAVRNLIGLNRLEKKDTHADATDLVRRSDIDALAMMVQAGLYHVDDKLTGETVYKWLDEAFREDRVEEVRDAILDALKASNFTRMGAATSGREDSERPPVTSGTGG